MILAVQLRSLWQMKLREKKFCNESNETQKMRSELQRDYCDEFGPGLDRQKSAGLKEIAQIG
ncbi:hypothetical protein FIU93_28365 [Labrenzia sp. THAF35]|uniref:hypothetical protein n=1 Tax=Labrenzia sp. THAF35 TaxID=2587854 RepID=UPI0012696AE7|nr:hypothetical protein [Labrenzia sp. THAF35]QFT70732.1 hypothetical protein FIU93_28365 [Labrenzia sp. THAF35]